MFRQAPSFPYHDLGIVEDGNTASRAISKDAFVIWKGESYFASTDILQGATLEEDVNLTAIPDGVINGVVDAMNNNLPGFLGEVITVVSAPSLPFTYTATEDCWFYANTSCTDSQGWAIHLGTASTDPLIYETYGVNNIAMTTSQFIPLKNGQTIYCRANNSKPKYSHYRVFRMLR